MAIETEKKVHFSLNDPAGTHPVYEISQTVRLRTSRESENVTDTGYVVTGNNVILL